MKNRKLTDILNKRFNQPPKQNQRTENFFPTVKIRKELELAEKVWEELSGTSNHNYIQQQVIEFLRNRAYEGFNASNFLEAAEAQEKADASDQVMEINVTGHVLNHLMSTDEYDEDKMYQITNLTPINIASNEDPIGNLIYI